ncbi:suppressor of fused domain protein [Corynebacterium sp. A21]|uniref:suppressor of fused domain protein n=1 Tax=Corynebacterium sp. A21 TaxID=3457318 RepID=UPI003FD3B9EC
MNLDEGAYWVDSLFPTELDFHRVGDFHVGCADLGEKQQLACTADFGRVDTGLSTPGPDGPPMDVRSELFTIGRVAEIDAARIIGAAANFLRNAAGRTPAQPGQLIPGLGILAELEEDFTVRHGLLSVPYVWGPEVPQQLEPAGEVHGEGAGELPRLTVMLQIIMLTDDERDFALTYGIGDLQQELARSGADLLDWRR